MKNLSPLDRCINEFDTALKAVCIPMHRVSRRVNPANKIKETKLSQTQKKQSASLLRVNHAGEVCAQALYQGQALTARLTHIRKQMLEAAEEEIDHLAWCESRLNNLNSRPSYLNFFWYTGSFLIGALAGLAGDRISLGFVAETERQVSEHLGRHLIKLPKADNKTQAILTQMKIDEEAHAITALDAGGVLFPSFIRRGMAALSKLLTTSSYYI